MTSGMRICVIALICLTMSARGLSAGMSTFVANFLSTINSPLDNLAQYQTDNKTYDYIQLRCVPVIVSALPGRTVLFTEYSYNGIVLNLYLNDVTADKHGNIHLTINNFTDSTRYKPGELKVEDLYKVKPEDLETQPGCKAVFQLRGPNMYIGTWPECRHYINGIPDLYALVATCNSMDIFVPSSAVEKRSSIPYKLDLIGNKFKVPGVPDGFVSPCTYMSTSAPNYHLEI